MSRTELQPLLSERWKPRPSVISVTRDDETIILDAETSHYYALTGVGGRIWELLCDSWPINAIIDQIAQESHELRTVIDLDVRALVSELQARLLVVVA